MKISSIIITISICIASTDAQLNAEISRSKTAWGAIKTNFPAFAYAIRSIPTRISRAAHNPILILFGSLAACTAIASLHIATNPERYDIFGANERSDELSRFGNFIRNHKRVVHKTIGVTIGSIALGATLFCFYQTFKLPETIAGKPLELLN